MDKLLQLEISLFRDKSFNFITGDFPKQKQALDILTDNETIELTYGGAAGGAKTWTGAEWEIFTCLAYPGVKGFIGREELKRLRDTTLITFYKVCKKHRIQPGEDFKYNGQDHYMEFRNGSRIDLLDLKFLPSDPLYERYGSSEYTFGMLEECGEIHFGAYDTLKSRIGRHLNDHYGLLRKLYKTCNPKKNWLYYDEYKPFKNHSLPEHKKFIQAFVQDNPYIESGYIDSLKSIKDKIRKERLLYGNWEYDDDPAKLIEYDNINNLFTNDFIKGGDKYVTADIARFGKDKTVIFVWNNWRVEKIKVIDKASIPENADAIKQMSNKHQISMSNVLVDEDGLGGGVKDILRCKGFIGNSQAVEVKGQKENYTNLRSQCYFRLADRINNNGIFIDSKDENFNTFLREELEVIKQKDIDKDNKMAIIAKDKIKELIGRSPDYSDTLMMRELFNLDQGKKILKWSII